MISAIFEIEPVAKGRPRLGRYCTYTPAKTARFEREIKNLAHKYAPESPLTGALVLNITFIMKIAKRMKRTEHTIKPDLDNLLKSVTDALNKIFWEDDQQIVEVHARKIYDYTNPKPRIEMEVREK